MSIRTKLFVFIPLLVVLINSVSFFIFQSGKTVQENYNLMMERILLYKQISQKTQENLRSLSSYLIDQNPASLDDCRRLQEELAEMKQRLSLQQKTNINEMAIGNYGNLLDTFLEQQKAVLAAANAGKLQSYVPPYEETQKAADFIKEEGQSLVDLELSYYQPFYREILVNTQLLNKLGAALFVVNTLLSIVFAIWLSRGITGPISRLVHTAKQISRGNWFVSPPQIRSGGEFRILSETFQQMLHNLKKLVDKEKESLEKDRLVKELELKALQSQINPHFLFNTLNVLSKLALLEGAEKTSDLTVSVSNLLRYNLRKLDRPVTLREEIEHAREYFAIQESRFRDRVRFEMDIDETALDLPIPCLTLQPILENAFVHGIESMERGAVIRLSVRRQADVVVIEISDNGAGMPEHVRRALLRTVPPAAPPASEGHSTGLGVQNVFKRLELFYGRGDLVEIESAVNKGTTVRMKLPYEPPEFSPEREPAP